jgi:hypothetical protein
LYGVSYFSNFWIFMLTKMNSHQASDTLHVLQ